MLDTILGRSSEPTTLPRATAIEDIYELFHLLRVPRRRRIIEHLRDGPLTRDELLHRMTVDKVGPDYGAHERKRELIGLHQQHGTPLIEAGIIEHDDDGPVDLYSPGVDHGVAVHVLDHCSKLFR